MPNRNGSTRSAAWSRFDWASAPVESEERRPDRAAQAMSGTEIIFEISEDELDGGYSASALGFGIHTEGETLDELRHNIKEAVDCYFDDSMERPRLIRLHYVRDEVLVA